MPDAVLSLTLLATAPPRDAVGFALLVAFVLGVWAWLTVSLARRVHADTARRCQNVRLWTALTAVFGVAGYAAYRVFDDAESRRIKAPWLPALSLVLMLWALALPALLVADYRAVLPMTPGYSQSLTVTPAVPPKGYADVNAAPKESSWPFYAIILGPLAGFFGPWIVFAGIYAAARPRITLEKIRERLDERGQLAPSDGKLLSVRNLVKHFPVRHGVFGRTRAWVKAVDGVSFDLEAGKTLGLVGESGCGKTTTGRLVLALIDPTAGDVVFDRVDLKLLSAAEMRAMRREMQLIFQDPYGSLNPRMTVLGIVGEAMTIHGLARGREREPLVAELLEKVGLDRRHIRRYPHEFSGGQRQRIGIARALALKPRFIACDEPVSALDVSIQAQIINLLADLQKEFGLSYLFIAHDLSVVEHVSDDVAVMYLGKIMEKAPAGELYKKPLHPYTLALLSAVPVPDPDQPRNPIILEGDIPSPINPPAGCRFHPRCRYAIDACKAAIPDLREIEPNHFAACIRAEMFM